VAAVGGLASAAAGASPAGVSADPAGPVSPVQPPASSAPATRIAGKVVLRRLVIVGQYAPGARSRPPFCGIERSP